MKIINPNKIKKVDIVVGIPSYNESGTIANITKIIDKGLQKYFKDKKAVIINADNNSPDKTGEIFLKTKTKTPKMYVSTPKDIKGKGNNFHNIFKKAKTMGAKAIAVMDSDVESATPEWVKCFIAPILEGRDYITPIYHRNEYDGSITNNICYPLIYGLFGMDIRQPIGGDFGFSSKLSEYWLKQKWPKKVTQFGIDIFMTLQTIKGNFNFCQVYLGSKAHKPSAPNLGPMFNQVTETLLKNLIKTKKIWKKTIEQTNIPLVCEVEKITPPQKLPIDYKFFKETALFEFKENYELVEKYLSKTNFQKIKKMFFSEDAKIDIKTELWVKILYDMLYAFDVAKNKQEAITALRPLYFGKMVSFIKETLDKNHEESEYLIRKQADCFFKNRNYLLKKYSS